MNATEEKYGWLHSEPAYVSLKHEVDKVIVYERAGLLFVFNFHPTKSFTKYRVGVDVPGEYTIILSSDEMRFGGFRNVVPGGSFLTTPLECNERKNFTQVSVSEQAEPTAEGLRRHGVQVYIPSRTCIVLAKK